MSETTLNVKNISKFNGENFQLWKFQVRNILVAHDLLEIVEGTEKKPESTATNAAAVKSWIKSNAEAMFVLSSSIEYSHLQYLITCNTAAEMWSKLSSIHEQKTSTNKLALTTKFHEHRMAAGDSIAQHISKIENMASQLKDIDVTVSDTMIQAKILGSLPTKFHPFISAWESVPEDKQTLDNLRERLLREENRLSNSDDTCHALASMTISNGKNQEKTQGNSGNNHNSKKRVKCNFCKKPGHLEKYCFAKKRQNRNANKNSRENADSQNSNVHENSSNYSAFVAHNNSTQFVPRDIKKYVSSDETEHWLLDSGASRHMCHRKDWFAEFAPTRVDEYIFFGDGSRRRVEGRGKIMIQRLVAGVWYAGEIRDVLYVPSFEVNLLSIGVCTEKGMRVVHERNMAKLVSMSTGELLAEGVKLPNNLVCLFIKTVIKHEVNYASSAPLKIWHERLGHVNRDFLCKTFNANAVTGANFTDSKDYFCESCPVGKQIRLPFSRTRDHQRALAPGETLHTDLCGPMQTTSVGGARFFLLFKDDASNFRKVFFLKHKSDCFDALKFYILSVNTQFGKNVKVLRSDNGTEYLNNNVKEFLKNLGTRLVTSAPYTPQQNGRAEREMRSIVESARTMLLSKGLPTRLWAEAVNTAVYILNRTLNSSNSKQTPFEIWFGRKPDISHVRIFGSECFAQVPNVFRKKWDAKARKLILVGHENESMNYRLFDPDTGNISVSRNVTFNENALISGNKNVEEAQLLFTVNNDVECGAAADNEPENEPDNEPENERESEPENERENEPENELDASVISLGANEDWQDARDAEQADEMDDNAEIARDGAYNLRARGNIQQPDWYGHRVYAAFFDEPLTYRDAINCEDSDLWKRAIADELEAHARNKTWEITELPKSRRAVGFKWAFKIKNPGNDGARRYKARFCAQGFSQEAGTDYDEIFSPVVRFESIRVLLAIAVRDKLYSAQFDVSTAYLNSTLAETIYMRVPDGLVVNKNNAALRLKKAIYGLKQSGRCWNERFDTFIKRIGFKQSNADKCVYIGVIDNCKVYLALYVDDGLILCEKSDTLNKMLRLLESEFKIVSGELKLFVGMEILHERNFIFISQRDYIDKVLKRFGMIDANEISTPADPHARLSTNNVTPNENVPYREAVGSLLFLSQVSRPDIAFATGVVSRYLDKYDESHWRAVKRIMRYLKATRNYGILYDPNCSREPLVAFSDADYANDMDTRRSTSGYAMMMCGGCVVWASRRQACVSLSTTEAEFIAASEATKEIVWLRKLLADIGCTCNDPTVLYMDNQSAIRLTRNPEFHRRSKHIDVRYHYIIEKIKENVIDSKFVKSGEQFADVLTKALPFDKFNVMRDYLNVIEYIPKIIK
ncbi:hypothetical protein TKK_0017683 [Trichogramma kaykai]|uniref:Integrase catalytic domain-containing protein n=1 Tax=Trichogramma kaykai TaxID=54128 RepID=A0ABD2W2H2_9HYME